MMVQPVLNPIKGKLFEIFDDEQVLGMIDDVSLVMDEQPVLEKNADELLVLHKNVAEKEGCPGSSSLSLKEVLRVVACIAPKFNTITFSISVVSGWFATSLADLEVSRLRVESVVASGPRCTDQFMHSPSKSHLKLALRILKFLRGDPGKGVHISKSSNIELTAYVDFDWAKCKATRRSVIGLGFFLEKSLVFWKSKKQTVVDRFFDEAEYKAVAL
ncbi:ribonuclease H-like domain-containing protein [Tanacetum coccineum]